MSEMPWKGPLQIDEIGRAHFEVRDADNRFVFGCYSNEVAAAFVSLANASSPPSPDAAGLAKHCDNHARADWDTLANENTAIARGLLKRAARALADRDAVIAECRKFLSHTALCADEMERFGKLCRCAEGALLARIDALANKADGTVGAPSNLEPKAPTKFGDRTR